MDMNKANIIRKVIRILGCVVAAVAAITAFVFRSIRTINTEEDIHRISVLCNVARIFAIVMFVFAVGLLVFDIVTKAFSPKIAAIGLVIALVGFIGNFIISVASTDLGLALYLYEHANLVTGKIDAAQLNIGAYMILASGVFTISYNAKCMKSGT